MAVEPSLIVSSCLVSLKENLSYSDIGNTTLPDANYFHRIDLLLTISVINQLIVIIMPIADSKSSCTCFGMMLLKCLKF